MTQQTAAERRAAEAHLGALLSTLAPQHEALVQSTRRWVRRRLPTAHELIYEYASWLVLSYAPGHHGHEGIIAIRIDANGVRLCLSVAAGLPDPEKLLQGSGGQMRWIPVEGASTLARPAVKALAEAAITRTPKPFAPSGRGPLIVRASQTKARPRRAT